MVGEIRFEQIWHVRGVGESEDQWAFSVNYKVPLENPTLRRLLQGETVPPIKIAEREDLLGLSRVLVTEIRGRTEYSVEISDGGYSIKAARRLDRLMRKPTLGPRTHRLICVGDVLGPGGRKIQEFQEEFDLDDLSAGSRAAVRRLDLLGTENAYRIFGEKAAQLDGYPSEVIPTPKKVAAFIGYRRSHVDIAGHLYALLQSISAGTLFDPYIDRHDMRLGDWAQQIFDRIDSSDIFIALVSPDYAEQGSFGLEEYRRGVSLSERNGWDDFFAPIFLGSPSTEAGIELREKHGFPAESAGALTADNQDFMSWIGAVAAAGLSRDREKNG